MVFYFSLFLITFSLLVFKKRNSNRNVVIIFILFILLYGCRNYGGVDDFAYISAFNNANDGNVVYGMEESFIVISKYLGALGFNYKALFFLYASISFIFMYLAYKELCKNKYEWIVAILGFLVFSFLPTITVMRQFAAASILTYALTIKLKEKNGLSLVFVGIASMVHLGSVIGFLLFPLFSIKLKPWIKFLVPIICFVIGYFGLFNKVLNFFLVLIPNKYLSFLDLYSSGDSHIGILHILLITIYLLQFVLTSLYKTNQSSDKTIDFLECAQMVYFSMYFITLTNGWMSRVSLYFILFVPFIFKTFVTRFSLTKDQQILYMACFGAYVLLFIYQILNLPYTSNMSDLIPYNGSFDFRK